VAEIPDLPFCRATGSSRIEALDRVREMAARGALS
jgi:predicted RNase H-like HicB family nuclease